MVGTANSRKVVDLAMLLQSFADDYMMKKERTEMCLVTYLWVDLAIVNVGSLSILVMSPILLL